MAILLTAAMLLSVIVLSSCSLPSLEDLESKLALLGSNDDETDASGNPSGSNTTGGSGCPMTECH